MWLSIGFLAAAGLGVVVLTLQRLAMELALRRPRRAPLSEPGFSVLKPLCGLDDELEQNLEAYAALGYREYEVLLGVRDRSDPAYPVAKRLARRFPERFRVVLQVSSPGLNPKVNQLATLERAARFELVVVSDSNTRPPQGWLSELAQLFEDPEVACVSNPVTGSGHRSLGAMLDNLHLASSVGAGQLAAKVSADRNLVVGKSMALRKSALRALGGFRAYANALAEDYVMGRDVVERLGMKVAIAQLPVQNVAVQRSVASFFRRYLRWGVVHRTAVTLPTSLAQGLLNPVPLAAIAVLLAPSERSAWALAAVFSCKCLVDWSTARRLGCRGFGVWLLPVVALKDALLFITWANGLVSRTVEWRGNRLRVGAGSQLMGPTRVLTRGLA